LHDRDADGSGSPSVGVDGGVGTAVAPPNGMDLVYIALTVGFFAVSLALVELFDRL
jgi:hypothetical protein